MIDPRSAAFVIIDMQNGFIDPSSPLCVAGAAKTVPACARALDAARRQGSPVFHVKRSYAADGSDVEACRWAVWKEGGRPLSDADPESAAFPAELAPRPGDRVVVKPRFSAFFQTELDMVLRRLGVGTVVLAGTTTPNCVRSTCYDALSLGYNVVVVEDCTSSRTQAVQDANIEDMRHIGAAIVDCDEYCAHGLEGVEDTAGLVRTALRKEACE